MNDQVTEYINKIGPEWQKAVCTELRQIVLDAVPDVEEKIQYGKPHYRKNGKYACVMGTAKGWVSFTIFNAEGLQPPESLFESSENGDRKTIKIQQGQRVDTELLTQLVTQAANTL